MNALRTKREALGGTRPAIGLGVVAAFGGAWRLTNEMLCLCVRIVHRLTFQQARVILVGLRRNFPPWRGRDAGKRVSQVAPTPAPSREVFHSWRRFRRRRAGRCVRSNPRFILPPLLLRGLQLVLELHASPPRSRIGLTRAPTALKRSDACIIKQRATWSHWNGRFC